MESVISVFMCGLIESLALVTRGLVYYTTDFFFFTMHNLIRMAWTDFHNTHLETKIARCQDGAMVGGVLVFTKSQLVFTKSQDNPTYETARDCTQMSKLWRRIERANAAGR